LRRGSSGNIAEFKTRLCSAQHKHKDSHTHVGSTDERVRLVLHGGKRKKIEDEVNMQIFFCLPHRCKQRQHTSL